MRIVVQIYLRFFAMCLQESIQATFHRFENLRGSYSDMLMKKTQPDKLFFETLILGGGSKGRGGGLAVT